MSRHPRIPRPDPGHYQAWLNSWDLAMNSDGLDERTREMYLDVGRLFGGWLLATYPKIQDWDQVGRDELRGFFVWLREGGEPCPHALRDPADAPASCSGYGKGYVNNIGRSLQQFFIFWSDEEELPNPMDKVKVPSAPKPEEAPPAVLTPEQMALILSDAEQGRDFDSRRDAAILRLFLATGCRLAELAGLQLDDVDVRAREASVVGKGNIPRIVKFGAKEARTLDRYIRMRSKRPVADLPALWLGHRRMPLTANGIYQAVKARGERVGVPIYPHMLRHSFAHNYLDGGGAEGDLMALAGWKSPQMLRHYGRSAASTRARRAYDRVDVMKGL